MRSLLCWGGSGRWACKGVLGCASGQRGESGTAVFVWKSHTARNIPERLRNQTSFSIHSLAFLFWAVLLGTPAVLVMYAAGVGSIGQSKTNTPLSLSLSLSQGSASASSHAEQTQQRSECGRSPGASAPTTASPVSCIAAPYQSTLSLSGNLQPNRQLSIFYGYFF